MRNLKLLFLLIFCVIASCNKSSNNNEVVEQIQTKEYNISSNAIDSLEFTEYVLSDESTYKTENWLKFQELFLHLDALRDGNLDFFVEDKVILEGFMTELKTETPEFLTETSILVRLLAFETSAYKLHDEAVFNQSDTETLIVAIKEVLIAHSNLLFQINKKFEKDGQKIVKPS